MKNYCVTVHKRPLKQKSPGVMTTIALFLLLVLAMYAIVHQVCKGLDYDYRAKVAVERGEL